MNTTNHDKGDERKILKADFADAAIIQVEQGVSDARDSGVDAGFPTSYGFSFSDGESLRLPGHRSGFPKLTDAGE